MLWGGLAWVLQHALPPCLGCPACHALACPPLSPSSCSQVPCKQTQQVGQANALHEAQGQQQKEALARHAAKISCLAQVQTMQRGAGQTHDCTASKACQTSTRACLVSELLVLSTWLDSGRLALLARALAWRSMLDCYCSCVTAHTQALQLLQSHSSDLPDLWAASRTQPGSWGQYVNSARCSCLHGHGNEVRLAWSLGWAPWAVWRSQVTAPPCLPWPSPCVAVSLQPPCAWACTAVCSLQSLTCCTAADTWCCPALPALPWALA